MYISFLHCGKRYHASFALRLVALEFPVVQYDDASSAPTACAPQFMSCSIHCFTCCRWFFQTLRLRPFHMSRPLPSPMDLIFPLHRPNSIRSHSLQSSNCLALPPAKPHPNPFPASKPTKKLPLKSLGAALTTRAVALATAAMAPSPP